MELHSCNPPYFETSYTKPLKFEKKKLNPLEIRIRELLKTKVFCKLLFKSSISLVKLNFGKIATWFIRFKRNQIIAHTK